MTDQCLIGPLNRWMDGRQPDGHTKDRSELTGRRHVLLRVPELRDNVLGDAHELALHIAIVDGRRHSGRNIPRPIIFCGGTRRRTQRKKEKVKSEGD